ncbi:MAG: MATE family efflux transporter [Chloroflexi bacterium]|nr:MATE family efflux transporter [Chloroflexota bacterium]
MTIKPPKRRVERDWTKGNITGNLWRLSWPIIISYGLTQLGPTVDTFWVGKLGSKAIAGIGSAGIIVILANNINTGLLIGLRALVARHVGSGDRQGANLAVQQAFIIIVTFSAIMATIGIFFSDTILRLFGLEPTVAEQGAAYLRIQFLGTLTIGLRTLTESAMQASGDVKLPMNIGIFYRLFHVVLDPFLIFGWWIFPSMGVSGASLAGVLTQGVGGAIGMWFLFSGRTRLRLSVKGIRLELSMLRRLLKVGLPAIAGSVERQFANVVVLWLIVPFGTVAVAAHSLISRVDTFVTPVIQGTSQSSGVLAAQNLGAQQPERAERTVWVAMGLTTVLMIVFSVFVWFWAERIIGAFNNEPSLVKIGSSFLRIEIASFLALNLSMVLSQSLQTVGATMVTMVGILATLWGVQVPLSYLLPKFTSLGVYGIRWAGVVATVLRGLFYLVYFQTGAWKRKRI